MLRRSASTLFIQPHFCILPWSVYSARRVVGFFPKAGLTMRFRPHLNSRGYEEFVLFCSTNKAQRPVADEGYLLMDYPTQISKQLSSGLFLSTPLCTSLPDATSLEKNWGAQESLTYQGTHAPKSQRFFWNCLWPAQAADKFYFVIFKLTRMAAAAEHQERQRLWVVQLNTAITAPICPQLKLKRWEDRFTWSVLDSRPSLKLNNLVTKCTEKFLVLWIILCFLN